MRRRANLFSKILPGPAEDWRRERDLVLCFLTTDAIPSIAEARVGVVSAMEGDFGRETISENDGGTVGVDVKGGGGAFVVEFNIARIDDAAFFGVAFEVVAAARGAEIRPRARGADREWERDRVRVGIGPCRLALTSSSVASSPATMLPKLLGYTP